VHRIPHTTIVETEATFFQRDPTPTMRVSNNDVVKDAYIQVLASLYHGPRDRYVIIIYMENLFDAVFLRR